METNIRLPFLIFSILSNVAFCATVCLLVVYVTIRKDFYVSIFFVVVNYAKRSSLDKVYCGGRNEVSTEELVRKCNEWERTGRNVILHLLHT